MKKLKVIYSIKAKLVLLEYSEKYKKYYNELFKDSWIWSQNVILEKYNFDAKLRIEEIVDLIEEKLSDDLIKYSDNIAKIKWRSRTLIIKFTDIWEERKINYLEIK